MKRFGLFVVVALLTRAVLLGVDIVDIDEAAHIVGSWELMRGHRLYLDFADHKPPLVYVYYALAQLLLGRGMLAVRLLTDLLVVPLTAFAISAFFRHDRRGLWGGLLFLVFSAAFLGHDMLAVNCELLMLLPLAGALVVLREPADVIRPSRLLGAGLLLGLAMLFKYQAAFAGPALATAAAVEAVRQGQRRRLGRLLLALAMGAALPLLASWAAFAARGASGAFVYWNLIHNLTYVANPIIFSEALERAASYLLPFLLVTAPLWWAWWRSGPLFASPHQAALVSALLGFSIPPALLGLRFYPHYFIQLYLPLAMGAAPFASDLLRRPLGGGGRLFTAHTLLMLAGFTVANGVLYFATDVYAERRPVFRKMAQRLRADPCFAESRLFVWGFAPIFYYYADRPPASRFVFVDSTLVGHVSANRDPDPHLIRREHWDWLMSDLERNRPAYVLDTSPAGINRWREFPPSAFPRFARFLEDYERLDEVDGVLIYRRLGCGGARPPG